MNIIICNAIDDTDILTNIEINKEGIAENDVNPAHNPVVNISKIKNRRIINDHNTMNTILNESMNILSLFVSLKCFFNKC
ncbi:Uncharacterised protein [Mycoplasmopsis edwardii]|uniref:Uncharacterized protein n=1 Tax=Mycoplasmopsis edwardii TaxID=53558 RepID=A0A3B0PKF7_9BACT|nr:Uncharacterised protein [Mycoplasmopsis edwardii]